MIATHVCRNHRLRDDDKTMCESVVGVRMDVVSVRIRAIYGWHSLHGRGHVDTCSGARSQNTCLQLASDT